MSSKSAILSRPKSKVRRHFEDIELQNDNTHVMCKEGIVKRKTFIKVGRVVGTHGMRNHHFTTYSRQMEQSSAEILEQVKATITKFCTASAALTTDLWTSGSLDAYISLTVHLVDEMFCLHR